VKTVTLKGASIAEEFQRIVEEYVRTTYGPGGRGRRAAASPSETEKAVA
jgi:hypothetical protein